jgi:hypothetical protein
MRERWPLPIVGEGLRPARLAPPQVFRAKRDASRCLAGYRLGFGNQPVCPAVIAFSALAALRVRRGRHGLSGLAGWGNAAGSPVFPLITLASLAESFAAMCSFSSWTIACSCSSVRLLMVACAVSTFTSFGISMAITFK